MKDIVWRPAHLTSEQMEERRLAAAALLRQGRLSQAEIARQLGVSRASVCRWAATLAQQGRRGLKARPIPGRMPRLDEKAWARLGGSWTGVRWPPVFPPSAGPSRASRP
jgi:transposase